MSLTPSSPLALDENSGLLALELSRNCESMYILVRPIYNSTHLEGQDNFLARSVISDFEITVVVNDRRTHDEIGAARKVTKQISVVSGVLLDMLAFRDQSEDRTHTEVVTFLNE